MNKYLFIILLSIIIIGGTIFLLKDDAAPVITYFPIDKESTFELAETTLETNISSDNSSKYVTWISKSISKAPLYLRQDISLLYDNAIFKGVLNGWKQNNRTIELKNSFNFTGHENFQAISFHYGEVHKNNDIKSVYKMSHDQLHSDEKQIDVDDQLMKHWIELLTYFEIDPSFYEMIPLTDLYIYGGQTLPSLTQDETDKVIGQLWEGLYKNYAVPLLQQKDKLAGHYVPLILFAKQSNHLFVLFEWNDEKIKLIQKY